MASANMLHIKRDPTLAYRLSLVVALLTALVSAGSLVLGFPGLYGADPPRALGTTEAGLLVPGLLGLDTFNLVVGLPILVGSMWLARQGSLLGLLLWPGPLFYMLYWYVIYLIGAPFSVLFLLYVPLATLSAYATIAVVSTIDGEWVWERRYVVSPGLLLQYGLTPVGLAASMALWAVLTASPLDVAAIIALLAFLRGGLLRAALFLRPRCESHQSRTYQCT